MRNMVASVLSQKTGREYESVLNDVQRHKYLTAAEAVEYGIIDKVLHPKEGDTTKHE